MEPLHCTPRSVWVVCNRNPDNHVLDLFQRRKSEECVPEMLGFEVLWSVWNKLDWQLEHSILSLPLQLRATALVERIRLNASVAPGEHDVSKSFFSDTAIKALCVSASIGFTYLPSVSLTCTFRASRSVRSLPDAGP